MNQADFLIRAAGSGMARKPGASPSAVPEKGGMSSFDEMVRQKYRNGYGASGRAQETDGAQGARIQETDENSPPDALKEEAGVDEQSALALALWATGGMTTPVQQIETLETFGDVLPTEAIRADYGALAVLEEWARTAPDQMAGGVQAGMLPQQTEKPNLLPERPALAQETPQTSAGQNGVQTLSVGGSAMAERSETQSSKEQSDAFFTGAGSAETGRPVFAEPGGIPHKVGEAGPEPMDPTTWDFDAALTRRLTDCAALGQDRVEIQLSPQSLGSMTVTLTRGGDGSLQVALSVSNAKAFSMLEKHTDGLQNLLMAHTQASVRVDVQQSAEAQQAKQQFLNQNGGGHAGQQRQQEQQNRDRAQDFIQQIRLGLLDLDSVGS